MSLHPAIGWVAAFKARPPLNEIAEDVVFWRHDPEYGGRVVGLVEDGNGFVPACELPGFDGYAHAQHYRDSWVEQEFQSHEGYQRCVVELATGSTFTVALRGDQPERTVRHRLHFALDDPDESVVVHPDHVVSLRFSEYRDSGEPDAPLGR